MKVGIVGYGYWGPNLLRNFVLHDDVIVTMVADPRLERLSLLKKTYPAIKTTTSAEELIASDVDAVVIATPVDTHYSLAKKALESGKHVFVEKPLASTVRDAEELVALAARKKLTLMVDHTFVYSSAVMTIKKLIENSEIGELQYFDSSRINLGLFQNDINVLWDLAPHDISILLYLTGRLPKSVYALGAAHAGNGIEDLAYLTLRYDDNFLAHITASWISPVKIRQILIGGSAKMILYNDVEPTEKVKVYESGITVRSDEDKQKLSVDYRVGDIFIPKLENREPLFAAVEDFVSAVASRKSPRSSGEFGLNVVRILAAAEKSLAQNGVAIAL